MSEKPGPAGLAKSLQFLSQKKGLPPVHQWNPPFCGDIDMRIARDGRWFYSGSEITRERMVRMFSTVLRKDDNDYYLVTPVEKVRIKVDDAPFVAIRMDILQEEVGQVLHLVTNVGDEVVVDSEHPLRVSFDPETNEPSPYVLIRGRLEALIHRNVFYQLVELAEQRQRGNRIELLIISQGTSFSLGQFDNE